MAQKEWIKLANNSTLIYYRGNIVYRATYNRKMFRYPIYKIDKSHFNEKMFAILRDDSLYDVNEVVRSIDSKVLAVNKAFNSIVAEISKGQTIRIQDIDNYLIIGSNVSKVSVNDGLITHFERWIIENTSS